MKLLEDSKWPGMRHFDSHAYRTEDEQGVWDFAAGSMRTLSHPQGEGRALQRRRGDSGSCSASSATRGAAPGTARSLQRRRRARDSRGATFDLEAMRAQGYAYERLDQLTMEVLLGVR